MEGRVRMFLTLGVAAHVDAGKTTLCEQMLCHAGVLRRCGRVDHGDSFLDASALERARGITIFCDQACFSLPTPEGEPLEVTLMDTPGHADFWGETERALSALDAALLVLSCVEGVQSHTVTLFRQLRARRIPTLLFLNKADREGADAARVMAQMHRLLSPDCVQMTDVDAGVLREELAARDGILLERHFDGTASREDYREGARRAFACGALFPVLTGSALMDTGVDALMRAIASLCRTQWEQREAEPFSAQVYRVRRVGGIRYCYVRATAGCLSAREEVLTARGTQKAGALCAVQGPRLTPVERLRAGQTAALTGLDARPGERIGAQSGGESPKTLPVMSVDVIPVPPLERRTLLSHLRELEEEEPLLHVRPSSEGVSVSIMGTVQTEVLGGLLEERFGDAVRFLPPHVLYRETIASPVTGIGHYEPLRHYAEVWLRIEPGEPGSGVVFEADCAPNTLDANWQRLIGTHVLEREHPGVLTGSPLTDVRIRLVAGRAHLKHTEGGDFREATYRAIRQGLMQAKNVLLEPVIRFDMAMPPQALSRVTGELLRLGARMDAPEYGEEEVTLSGTCTAAAFWDYPARFAASTRGYGRLASRYLRDEPCREQEKMVEQCGYSPLADEQNPPGSVFCSHGAGFYVAWDHVREWAHCRPEK